VLLACVACGGAGAYRRGQAADSLTGARVRRVTIEGNTQFRDGVIVAKLAHRPRHGLPFFRKYTHYDPFALRVDVKRVEAFYRERGYYSARADAAVRVVSGRRVDVEFRVDEGPPTKIVGLDVRGVPADAKRVVDELVADSELAVGARLVHPSYVALKEAIARALVRRGYAHAEVTGRLEVDVARAQAGVEITVDPGPVSRFGEITVTGNEIIPTDVILARVAWRRGDRFDPRQLQLTERRLNELGVFGTIRIDYDRDVRAEWVDTEIVVTEAKRHEVKLGGGFGADNSRYEIRARAGYAVKSWLHPLINVRLDGRLGYAIVPGADQGRAVIGEGQVSVERRDLFAPRLRLAMSAWFEKDVFEAYSTLGPSLRVGFDRPFGETDRLRLSAGWQVRYLDITGDDQRIETALGISGAYRLAFFEQSISYDGRDDRFVPHRGVYLDLHVEEGTSYAGSAYDYLRLTPDARLYVPLGPLVLATRARLGWLRALGDDPSPLTQRYFAGGSASHRGFGFRKLAPTELDSQGDRLPIGGDALLETSAELRFPLPWSSFRGVLFVDGADSTKTFDELDLSLLHWAAGLGVRLDTIVGPVRLDFAYRLNRTEAITDGRINPPSGTYAIHLSLGEAF